MEMRIGEVYRVEADMFPAIIRSEGIFVRPCDGALVSPSTDGAVPFRPAESDESNLIAIPAGTLAVDVHEDANRQTIMRLPGGALISVQEMKEVTRQAHGVDGEPKEVVRRRTVEITSHDELKRLIESAPANAVDVGGMTVIALNTPFPGALGIQCFSHTARFATKGLAFDFGFFQAFTLPAGVRGVQGPRRTVADINGHPLVITETTKPYARMALRQMFNSLTPGIPPEAAEAWNVDMPRLVDEYGAVLDRIAPIASVWCATWVKEAWKRLAAAQG